MRVVIVYKKDFDYTRQVEEYIEEIYRRTGHRLEEIYPDSKDGSAFCESYDLVEYPSIVALDDNGKLLSLWRGLPLPLINEVTFYTKEL